MSDTVTPPPAETTPKAAIVAAQTPLDVVNAAIEDPEVMAVVNKYLGGPNGIPATVAGFIVTWIVAHYGLQLTPDAVGTLSAAGGLLLGFAWNWFSKRYLKPATPVTQGTTP